MHEPCDSMPGAQIVGGASSHAAGTGTPCHRKEANSAKLPLIKTFDKLRTMHFVNEKQCNCL